MDGLINLYKPTGITSAKALYKVRRLIGIRKIGHAGTLDPGAEGVLLLGVGKGTKLTERLMDLPKGYRARARLDVTSTSFDSDRPHEPVTVSDIPDRERLDAALATFVGVIQQVPPAVSALKVGGVAAYRLERRGTPPVLAARAVTIYSARVLRYAWPEVEFDVACGRGTYIRALIRDLGLALGVGGCLTGLCRTFVGPFIADAAVRLEDLSTNPAAARLLEIEAVIRTIAAWRSQRPEFESPGRPAGRDDRTGR